MMMNGALMEALCKKLLNILTNTNIFLRSWECYGEGELVSFMYHFVGSSFMLLKYIEIHLIMTCATDKNVNTVVFFRMFEEQRKNWRRSYKGLLLLAYLIKNGSERVVTSAREHLYDLRGLESYTFIDEFGKDQGSHYNHTMTLIWLMTRTNCFRGFPRLFCCWMPAIN